VQELVQKYSARLWLVHVLTPVPIVGTLNPAPGVSMLNPTRGGISAAVPLDIQKYDQERMQTVQNSLDALKNKFTAREIPVQAVIKAGSPADEIVKLAQEEHIDLLVTATHGRTGLSRFVFGSVAEKLVRLSPCPVLVVPSLPRE
jgi:nucleotide-binding universal stress UspA family protein